MDMDNGAIRLLADVLVWPEEKINEVYALRDSYKMMKKLKKDGSYRILHEPNPVLKEFQKRFLKYFLYKIPLDNFHIIKGCRPKSSHIDNAKWHSNKNTRFVLRLDLKDAFPSVKKENIRSILQKFLFEEIERYKAKEFPMRPLFSIKRAQWFRKLFKDFPQLNLFYGDSKEILDDFIELVISLVTYKESLPQGAPTSPYLLNIVLSHSSLIEKIYQFLWDNKIFVSKGSISQILFSVYVDDFTISSSKPIPKSVIDAIIGIIEQESPFKVNKNKTLYFKRDRIAPMITGLRLVTIKKSRQELEIELKKEETYYNSRELKNIRRKLLDENDKWHIETVRLPKKQIRKIRGLVNAAATNPQLRSKLASKVEGHITSLKAVYGNKLPRQISVPYEKYLKSL